MELITDNNIKYFKSELLKEHHFIHAFFTKRYKNNNPIKLQHELNLTSNIHYMKQVHSNKIIHINDNLDLKNSVADCLITKERLKSLWIYTADCMPILIADINTRNVAACHVGVERLKKRIISKVLKKFIEIGSNKNNLIIAIGPAISLEKYQVKIKDVAELLIEIAGKKIMHKSYFSIEFKNLEPILLFKKGPDSEKLLIDLQAAAYMQLNREGIKESQINLNRFCTYLNPKLFNSFRRDNTKLRQWSCIYS